MPTEDIFAILFILIREKEATNHFLCDYFTVTSGEIEQAVERLQEAGFKITVDRQRDPTYQLQTPLVMYKRFVTIDQLFGLYMTITNKPKPKTKKAIAYFAAMLEEAERRLPDGSLSDISYDILIDEPMHPFVAPIITDIYPALRDRKVINMDYIDAKYDRTNRDIEPMEIFYQDQSWYLWAYCYLREDFRVFKISQSMQIHPTKKKFIRRPFTIFEGLNDPRSFRDFYFVTMEFDLSLKKQVDQIFRLDKKLLTDDKIVILEKDLYSFEYAKAWLEQFGNKVTVTDPPQLRDALK